MSAMAIKRRSRREIVGYIVERVPRSDTYEENVGAWDDLALDVAVNCGDPEPDIDWVQGLMLTVRRIYRLKARDGWFANITGHGEESQREYESRLVALRDLVLDVVAMDSHLDRVQALDFGWGTQ